MDTDNWDSYSKCMHRATQVKHSGILYVFTIFQNKYSRILKGKTTYHVKYEKHLEKLLKIPEKYARVC